MTFVIFLKPQFTSNDCCVLWPHRSGPVHRWELENSDSLGGVISLDNYDITSDGLMDLLVGRDDGSVEIYGFDEADEPIRRFKQVG